MIIQIVEDDLALIDGIVLTLKEPESDFVKSMTVRMAKEEFDEKMPELLILDINLFHTVHCYHSTTLLM